MESLDIYRGLIIVKPYGTYIKKKIKKMIVKSRNVKQLVNNNLLLIENKLGLGIIRLNNPFKIDLTHFRKLFKYHRISENDRKKWWPEHQYLYAYPIISSKIFSRPIILDYPKGPQITIMPDNLILKKIFVGMSGYYYKYMYPKGVKNILDYYSKHLNSVEINHTFYHFPSKAMICKLSKYNLVYSIKVHHMITHNKKFKKIDQYWKIFYNSFKPIHENIYCFLFQMSPKFIYSSNNYDKIKQISKILNKNHRYAFEFRNVEWFNSKVDKLFRKNNWSYVIININNDIHWAGNLNNGFNPPLSRYNLTSDFIYLRMHGSNGQYIGSYSERELNMIYHLINKEPIKYAFIYFNNTDSNSDAFVDSYRFLRKFNELNI